MLIHIQIKVLILFYIVVNINIKMLKRGGKINYINELVQKIKNSKTDEEITSILEHLCKPIIDMTEILKNGIIPNDEVIEPYEIDLSYNGISIYKSWYDFDAKEVGEEKIYHIGYVDFFKSMFDIPIKRT